MSDSKVLGNAARKPPSAGKGRKKGVPNKATADVRGAIALLAQRNVDKLESWLMRTARKQPHRAAELFLRALEYHIPKVNKLELSGPDGGPIQAITVTTDDPIEAGRQYQKLISGQ